MGQRGRIERRSVSWVVLASVAATVSGCAEVYAPRPSASVVITGNGGSGYHVFKEGQMLGDQSAVETAVAGDPRAEREAEKASSERAGSFASNILGAACWGAGWVMFGEDASSARFPTTVGDVGIGLIVGGAVLYIVGGVLQGNAHTHMFNAVNMYNDDLAARGRPAPPPMYGTPPPPMGAPVYVSPGPGYAPQPVYPVAPAPQPLPPLPPERMQ